VETRRFKPRLVEVLVLAAGVLVAVYAAWVIRNVGASTPDDSAPPVPVETLSERPTPSPTAPPSLAAFRAVLGDAGSVLVVGDSTGNDPGEWVDLWAQDLAGSRQVTLRQWQAGAEQFAEAPLVYGSGRGVEIWNLSYPGVRADYAQRLQEVPKAPGVVILSIGHDRSPQALRRAVRTTSEAIDDRWGEVPTAWVLQNPSTGETEQQQKDAVTFLRSLAMTERVPVIDVHRAFRKAGSLDGFLLDASSPNDRGSRLWADTVNAAVSR
jgi:hypothetical protein